MLRFLNLMVAGALTLGLTALALAQEERKVERKVILDEDGHEVHVEIITEGADGGVFILGGQDEDDGKKKGKSGKKAKRRKKVQQLHKLPAEARRFMIRHGDDDSREFVIDLDDLVDCPNCDVEGKIKIKIKGIDMEGLEGALSQLENIDVDVRSMMPELKGHMKDAMHNFKFFDGKGLPGGRAIILHEDDDDEDEDGDHEHRAFRIRPFGKDGHAFAFGPEMRHRVWTEVRPHVERGIHGARKHIEKTIRRHMKPHREPREHREHREPREHREHREHREPREHRQGGRDSERLRELRENLRELQEEMRELDREIERMSRRL